MTYPTNQKYRAKPVFVNLTTGTVHGSKAEIGDDKYIFFGSTFEYRVYRELSRFPGLRIERQKPLIVKPGAGYPAKWWRVDFQVSTDKGKILNVEAKGLSMPDFLTNLQLLDIFNPEEYGRLVVVTEYPRTIDKRIRSIGINQVANSLVQFGLLPAR